MVEEVVKEKEKDPVFEEALKEKENKEAVERRYITLLSRVSLWYAIFSFVTVFLLFLSIFSLSEKPLPQLEGEAEVRLVDSPMGIVYQMKQR